MGRRERKTEILQAYKNSVRDNVQYPIVNRLQDITKISRATPNFVKVLEGALNRLPVHLQRDTDAISEALAAYENQKGVYDELLEAITKKTSLNGFYGFIDGGVLYDIIAYYHIGEHNIGYRITCDYNYDIKESLVTSDRDTRSALAQTQVSILPIAGGALTTRNHVISYQQKVILINQLLEDI